MDDQLYTGLALAYLESVLDDEQKHWEELGCPDVHAFVILSEWKRRLLQ
jgi:hypothetical protein